MADKIKQEKKTIQGMIKLYCRKQHGRKAGLCPECQELLEYAWKRLDACKFGENKTACAKCPVHCYKPEMRKRVVEVMRFSGPKMIWHDPLGAMRHLLQGSSRQK